MTGIEYRQATQADIPELVRLRWEFRTESDEVDPKLSRGVFEKGCSEFLTAGLGTTWTYWIAKEADKIISHAFVQRVTMVPNPDRIRDEWGYLTNCYTIPSHRGRGIGSELMKSLISWARERNLELLIVWPSDESVTYYERLGFSLNNDIMQLSIRM